MRRKIFAADGPFPDSHILRRIKGKLVTKGTYAKMARGEMVRFMAENSVQEVEGIKDFDRLGYEFREDISTDTEYVFERKVGEKHGFRYSKG